MRTTTTTPHLIATTPSAKNNDDSDSDYDFSFISTTSHVVFHAFCLLTFWMRAFRMSPNKNVFQLRLGPTDDDADSDTDGSRRRDDDYDYSRGRSSKQLTL